MVRPLPALGRITDFLVPALLIPYILEQMTKLCRLIYRSKTSWDSLTFLTNSLLRKLAVDSTSRNKEKDITGILLLSDESFLQVLEGPEDAVNALYCKIIQDKLHSDVTLISYEQIANKSFDEWSMRVLDLNDLPKPAREVLLLKYKGTEGYVDIPNDAPIAMALLLDARAFCLSEAESE